jgi:hypothetical protein
MAGKANPVGQKKPGYTPELNQKPWLHMQE